MNQIQSACVLTAAATARPIAPLPSSTVTTRLGRRLCCSRLSPAGTTAQTVKGDEPTGRAYGMPELERRPEGIASDLVASPAHRRSSSRIGSGSPASATRAAGRDRYVRVTSDHGAFAKSITPAETSNRAGSCSTSAAAARGEKPSDARDRPGRSLIADSPALAESAATRPPRASGRPRSPSHTDRSSFACPRAPTVASPRAPAPPPTAVQSRACDETSAA